MFNAIIISLEHASNLIAQGKNTEALVLIPKIIQMLKDWEDMRMRAMEEQEKAQKIENRLRYLKEAKEFIKSLWRK